MKKLLLTLFISFNFYQSKSQVVFCPPGAEWRYIYNATNIVRKYNGNIYYTRDSLIGTETVKVLKYDYFYKKQSFDYCKLVLLKQIGDTVFMRNCNTSGTWQILYNFAATAGQSWVTTLKDSAAYGSLVPVTQTVVVNAVTTVTINNMSLKKLLVSYCYISNGIGQVDCENAEIIERIGCTTYLFNYHNRPGFSDYHLLTDFLCYKDNAFGIKEFSDKGCDYYVGISEHSSLAGKVKLYPVPVNDLLSIEFSDTDLKNYDIKIVDALGQMVLDSKPQITNFKTEVDVSSLQSGVYFLQLFDAGKLYGVQKIIKEY